MNGILITVLLLFAVTLMWAALRRLRQFRLKERYALIFLACSVPFLGLAANPDLITRVAGYLGIDYRTLQLMGVTAFLLFIVIELLTIVSVQERRITQLAQQMAMLEQPHRQASQREQSAAELRAEPTSEQSIPETPKANQREATTNGRSNWADLEEPIEVR